MGKRKRSHPHKEVCKRAKIRGEIITAVNHPTLSLYYRNILTLKDYLLLKLPATSKARRRRIASTVPDTPNFHRIDEEINTLSQDRHSLSRLLTDTLICTVHEHIPEPEPSRIKDLAAFSQRFSPTAGSTVGSNTSSLSELVDYVIWRLFYKIHRNDHRPPHMLCHGFQRASNPRQANEDHCAVAGIAGLVSYYPNTNVKALKGSSWTEVLALLGKEGEKILLDLFLDCGIFIAGEEGLGNYYQLSGRSCWALLLFRV